MAINFSKPVNNVIDPFTAATKALNQELSILRFSDPVTHVYNPLEYAWQAHAQYLQHYAKGQKKILFLGMNPGPWGMAQTGIPFGEVHAVSSWMHIRTEVEKPNNEHPKRPILGFNCPRSEVSGRRLWSFFAQQYPQAQEFFKTHFVINFCPLVWMAASGRNITPDKLPKAESSPVDLACRKYLATFIQHMQPNYLIGVGAFAEKQLKQTTQEHIPDYHGVIAKILHPSPASPAANRGWAEAAMKQLHSIGCWEE